ncbi:MAG: hypothetical protein EOO10_13870 [Chitinophagaceae bacterium]|nr:MAG: hypothetical protein EOO10_13870 [Chitinophagaceae bacterium]
MSLRKYIRRNIYKWHRTTSLLIALPVLLWTISGFLHPIMGSFKPDVKNSFLPAAQIDSTKITVSLQDALLQNGIERFQSFRIVKLYKGFYYQVQQKAFDSLTYINCESGNTLSDGDKHYANYLAQRFLWEETGMKATDGHDHAKMTASVSGGASVSVKDVSAGNPKSKITSTRLLTSFTKDYKASNKLLPVYEVSFDREDGITLYIETKAERLAFASDQKKRWFSSFFAFAHSWSFLNELGKFKSFMLGTFAALCLLSSVFGFAVYNVLNTKKKPATKSKRWHRALGNVFLLTTVLYAFSGAWHAFAKLPAKANLASLEKEEIDCKEVPLNMRTVYPFLAPDEKLANVSVVRMNEKTYWQVFYKKGKEVGKKYINTKTNVLLPDGDAQYSAYLASRVKGLQQDKIVSTKPVTAFSHSYSMMNKRLPVVENKMANGEAVYIETSTGDVAAVTDLSGKAERFSFSNLHMHHYWEMWLGKEKGKTIKNTVLIATTAGLLLLALTGVLIYLRKRFL